jgi:small redox-active disulfide protein 1
MVKVEFFYSPRCPHCRRARSVVGMMEKQFKRRFKKGLVQEMMEVEMVNILMPGGRKRAINYGISGVPTIVVNGKKKIVGVPRKKDLREPIEKAMEKKG